MNVSRVVAVFALLGVVLSGHSRAEPAAAESTQPAAGTQRYTIEPAPAWVQPVEPPPSAEKSTDPSAQSPNGVEYLLIDRQTQADQSISQYVRLVTHLVNSAGVEHESQLTLDFDPERDRLIIHAVTVRRGSQTFDQLKLGHIEVLRREPALESRILDGALTFHLLMSDVRVGDVLEYSYTLERREKEWGDRFFAQYPTRWDSPVVRSHLRVLTRPGTSVHLLDHTDQRPTTSRAGDFESREWNWLNVPAHLFEGGTPVGYEQSNVIQLSQFESWGEMVRTALPLFSISQPGGSELTESIGRMKAGADSDMARALAILRFVQEEVRYTGVELGERAYRPTSPDEVLHRRYGDCKDKALLTVALLRGVGIDAAPALVSTRWQAHARDRLPSPLVFNHAIVRARIRGTTFWLDPTLVAQGGDLKRYTQGYYGAALVLAPGVTDLESIPRELATDPLTSSTSVYDFSAGVHKEANLSITTIYRGSAADNMRETLRTSSPEEIANRYLNYYKNRYPEIRSAGPLITHDDVAANTLRVEESYVIAHGFEIDKDGEGDFEVEAELVRPHLGAPDNPARTTPMALTLPVNVTQHIELKFQQLSDIDERTKVIRGPGFEYHSRVARNKNTVILDYHYQTLADQVAVADLGEFLKKREEARRDASYTLSATIPPDPGAGKENTEATAALQKAYGFAKEGNGDKAKPILNDLIASKAFGSLQSELQRAALVLAGAVAVDEHDGPRALALLKRATELEGAGAKDWQLRLQAAQIVQDRTEAMGAVITIAQRWPDALGDLPQGTLARILRQTPAAGPGRYKLLKALYDAKLTFEGFPASAWWRDLALLQLERGERAEAIQTLSQVFDPYVAISILADKRFDSIRPDIQSQLDVDQVSRQQVDFGREIVRRNPGKVQPIIELTYFLIYAQRYQEALALCDEVIAKVSDGSGAKIYSDYAGKYVWILDNRSRALYGLGRWDEALAVQVTASHLPELEDDNVSQIINLAAVYDDLSRPKEARETLAALDPNKTSGYGRTQVAIALLDSALQLGDATEAEHQLQYLREHREDSISTLQQALVIAGREDEAAQLLISRLEDANERIAALLYIQDYQSRPATPRVQELEKRWKTLIGRSDVQAAITKVGTVGHYPVRPPLG